MYRDLNNDNNIVPKANDRQSFFSGINYGLTYHRGYAKPLGNGNTNYHTRKRKTPALTVGIVRVMTDRHEYYAKPTKNGIRTIVARTNLKQNSTNHVTNGFLEPPGLPVTFFIPSNDAKTEKDRIFLAKANVVRKMKANDYTDAILCQRTGNVIAHNVITRRTIHKIKMDPIDGLVVYAGW